MVSTKTTRAGGFDTQSAIAIKPPFHTEKVLAYIMVRVGEGECVCVR